MRKAIARSGRVLLAATLALSVAWSAPAFGEEAAPAASLLLELNGAEASPAGCRLTFVIRNDLGAALERAAFEIVLFDDAGLVERLAVLDFKELPEGKTKVRQFDIPGADCARVGRVLVNDAVACEGDGVQAGACLRGLVTETKSTVAFGS